VSSKEKDEDQVWIYHGENRGVDGVFPPLVNQLSNEVEFDRVQFSYDHEAVEAPWNRKCVLGLRKGIYRILKINMVREVGRTVVRLRIMKQTNVRRIMVICRDHFDKWFKVKAEENSMPGKVSDTANSSLREGRVDRGSDF